MGSALAQAWSGRHRLIVHDVEVAKARRLGRRCHAAVARTLRELLARSEVVVLAVKPQDLDAALRAASPDARSGHRFLSIAAGVTTRRIERWLGGQPRVVRIMPNLAARVGEAISSVSRGRWASRADLAIAERLFGAVGRVVVVPERLVDAVTAVSGSGPAYHFLLAAHVASAGRRVGLPARLASQLAAQTLIGSGAVVCRDAAEPAALVAAVASRGGTTEAALRVFTRHRFGSMVAEAVRAAHRRARQLSR